MTQYALYFDYIFNLIRIHIKKQGLEEYDRLRLLSYPETVNGNKIKDFLENKIDFFFYSRIFF
jgi:hypothetical protein